MKTSIQTPDYFQNAVTHLFGVEGGYVNDPVDRGGETKYGITKRTYPYLDIASLTLEKATEIYHQDYWLKYHCHELPPALGVFLFDSLVNHRPKTAVRLLQMTLRVTTDGYIGPKTIAAASVVAGYSTYPEIIALALARRADLYHDIITGDSSQARFALGWFKRLFLLQQFIDGMAT